MKKLNYILSVFVISSLFTYTGCNDDDDEPDPISIIGTWVLVSESFSQCDDPLDNESEDFDCTDTECSRLVIDASTITFIGIDPSGNFETSVSYTSKESTLTILGQSANFTLVGSVLTISEQNPDSEGCIFTSIYNRE